MGIGLRDSQWNLAMQSIKNKLEISDLRQLSRYFVATHSSATHGTLRMKDRIALPGYFINPIQRLQKQGDGLEGVRFGRQ